MSTRCVELNTPALVLDLDVFERNLAKMGRLAAEWGVQLRPHAKAHKSPAIAHRQIRAGAIGVTCAKLSEAESLAEGGVEPILISTEIAGSLKIRRLVSLAQTCQIVIVIDDAVCADQISDAACEEGIFLNALVDVNIGQNRTGVEPGEAALDLARHVDRLPGLHFKGLQGYEGHLQFTNPVSERAERVRAAMQLLTSTRRTIEAAGLETQIVSAGGTGSAPFAATAPGVTEIQPGSYLFMDARYKATDGVDFEPSLFVLGGVCSTAGGSAIVDTGLKALTNEYGSAVPLDFAEAQYLPMGDEHGRVTFPGACPVAAGDQICFLPSHCDTTVNLYSHYHVVRGGQILATWPVAARGSTQ